MAATSKVNAEPTTTAVGDLLKEVNKMLATAEEAAAFCTAVFKDGEMPADKDAAEETILAYMLAKLREEVQLENPSAKECQDLKEGASKACSLLHERKADAAKAAAGPATKKAKVATETKAETKTETRLRLERELADTIKILDWIRGQVPIPPGVSAEVRAAFENMAEQAQREVLDCRAALAAMAADADADADEAAIETQAMVDLVETQA